jgi:hypothetical protein
MPIAPMPWHRRNPVAAAAEEVAVREAFPLLHFFPSEERLVIRGGFPVELKGVTLEWFQLEVVVPGMYPDDCPFVREIGGRIPRIPDRHMNGDGTACLFVPEERARYFPIGMPLVGLLRGPIRAFFIGQLYFERFGQWPFGERGHGAKGLLEFYAEALSTTNGETILFVIDDLRRPAATRAAACPCGSGIPTEGCHPRVLELRATVTSAMAEYSYAQISGMAVATRQARTL